MKTQNSFSNPFLTVIIIVQRIGILWSFQPNIYFTDEFDEKLQDDCLLYTVVDDIAM